MKVWYTHDEVKKHMRLVVVSLLVCVCTVIIVYLGVALVVGSNAEKDTKKQSDVILVLGARSYINGVYNPCLKDRVKHAVLLYNAKLAPKILMSGGDDKEDTINEAETMKKIAIEAGVPPSAILLERSATSTYENFTLSQKILKSQNLKSIIIVTEPFHMTRAALVAKKLAIPSSGSPVMDSSCWLPDKYLSKYFLKEPFAIALYKVQGKL